jgi:hypothetical protein
MSQRFAPNWIYPVHLAGIRVTNVIQINLPLDRSPATPYHAEQYEHVPHYSHR